MDLLRRTPGHRNAGPRFTADPIPPPAAPSPRSFAQTASILSGLLPEIRTVVGGFDVITIAVGGELTVPAGSSAWYGLIDVDPYDEGWGQEVGLMGLTIDQLSTDSVPGVGTIAWGTTKGHAAAIVIGTRLPCDLHAWTAAPCPLPGIETATDPPDPRSRYWFSSPFPPGRYDDTVPYPRTMVRNFGPHQFRLLRGMHLQAALVIRSSQINGLNGTVAGHVLVQLHAGLTRHAPFEG
ncbi:MAG: hypothetical protein KAS72_07815 [Phycisphaerales bacterium]|nr:hypothetical protein [Phycisphaerales bacterium]